MHLSITQLKRFGVAAALIGLMLWLLLIDPNSVAPSLLLVPFLLIFVLIFNIVSWVIHAFRSTVGSKAKAISLLISLILDALIVLSSLHELGLKDGIILAAIAIIGIFYIIKLMPVTNLN